MAEIKRAGRKSNAEAKDLQSLINKAEWEVRRNDATCCNDLPKLYAMQRDLAFGIGALGKGASVTNRKGAIDAMIKRGEEYATGEAPLLNKDTGGDKEEDTIVEEKQLANGSPVKSFAEKKAEYEAKKAAEKG